MTFDPVLPVAVLVTVCGYAIVLAWWRVRRGGALADVIRSTLVVALFVAMATDPATGGGEAAARVSNADVLFVVDTTGSIVAEDYGDMERPRLEGVKADLNELASSFSGARFSMITFDSQATVDLPWTSDRGAVDSAIELLRQEQTVYSAGSRLDVPIDRMAGQLTRSQQRGDDRVRFVFYLSDGEQTESNSFVSFAGLSGLIDGGAVFGYGTEAGGTMRQNYGVDSGIDDYIYDYDTFDPAISHYEESNLVMIADQLDVAFLHRTGPGGLRSLVDTLRELTATEQTGDRRQGARHWYWMVALVAFAFATWQATSTTRDLIEARRLLTPGGST